MLSDDRTDIYGIREFPILPGDTLYHVEIRDQYRGETVSDLGLIRVSCDWEGIPALVASVREVPSYHRVAAWIVLEREGKLWDPVLDPTDDRHLWRQIPHAPIRDWRRGRRAGSVRRSRGGHLRLVKAC